MELENRDEREIGIEDSIAYTMARLKKVLKRQGMEVGLAKAYTNLGWAVTFFNDEFILEAWMERGNQPIHIRVGTRVRRKRHVKMRETRGLSTVCGYLKKQQDPHWFESFGEQIAWLEKNHKAVFDTTLLNSDELNDWAVDAGRRRWGQKPRKRKKTPPPSE